MRGSRRLLLLAALIVVAHPAHAQHGGFGRDGREGDEPRPSRADSTRTPAGPWQAWGHVGVGWVGSPAEVRSRYGAGMDVGVSGDRRFGDRVALRARIEYHDFPSRQPAFVDLNGVAYATSAQFGHGWCGSGLAGVSVRTWRRLWLEGGFGGGRFSSGFASGQTYVDASTGRTLPLTGGTGWGTAWGAGARYEMRHARWDRMLAEAQLVSMDRAGTTLRFWAIRVGYRLF